jgi:hypothetical protein
MPATREVPVRHQGETAVPHYERYTTTVIGAHSVPRWYEAMDRLVSSGQLAVGDFTDAQLRATQAAILEQEIAGIDVITAVKCIVGLIIATPHQTRCLTISGRRFLPFRGKPNLSLLPDMIRTCFIPRLFAGDLF